MVGQRKPTDAAGWEHNDSVQGSLTHSNISRIRGSRNSLLRPPGRSRGVAQPSSSGRDTLCPRPPIGAGDEEKEDRSKGNKNEERGGSVGLPFNHDMRLGGVRAQGQRARSCRTPGYLREQERNESLLYSAAGSTNIGGSSFPHSSLRGVSVKDVAGSSGPAASRSQGSTGKEKQEQGGGNIQDHMQQKEGEEEGLGLGFDHPMRLEVLRALTRDGGAAPIPDNLPKALSIIKSQQGVILGISEANRHFHRRVQALEVEIHQIRGERDSIKRKHDALEATLASRCSSRSAAAMAETRARITAVCDDMCAKNARSAAIVQSYIEKEERRRAEEQANLHRRAETVSPPAIVREPSPIISVVALPPPSKHEGVPAAKASALIGREGTPSTGSITPPESTVTVPAQKPAAYLSSFSARAPEEARVAVVKKERASRRRSDNVRYPTSGSSSRVGLSAGPASRSFACHQPPAGSLRDVGPSECFVGQLSARQSKAQTAPPAYVRTGGHPAHPSCASQQPAIDVSGGAEPSVHPVEDPSAGHQQAIGTSGGGGPSTPPLDNPSSRRAATVASSRGVQSSVRRATAHSVRPRNGLTHRYRPPLSFMKATETSTGRVRCPIRTSAPPGMVF